MTRGVSALGGKKLSGNCDDTRRAFRDLPKMPRINRYGYELPSKIIQAARASRLRHKLSVEGKGGGVRGATGGYRGKPGGPVDDWGVPRSNREPFKNLKKNIEKYIFL